MTFANFKELDDDAKGRIALHFAIPVATREEGDSRFILYHLFSFYLEARINLSERELTHYSAFENTALLDPYLEEVSLVDLYFT